MPRLKVFRTTSGIHDHVVAAPSRPAALKAWGARTDLFSMGVASEVTEPDVKKKALEHPGEVIRFSRSGDVEIEPVSKHRTAKRRTARPSRKKLDAAEKRLSELATKQSKELDSIERSLRHLQKRRDLLAARHTKVQAAAELRLERARDAYWADLEAWSGD